MAVKRPCSHDVVFAGFCAACGATMKEGTVTDAKVFNAREKRTLTLRADAVETVRETGVARLVRARKLQLVLDLDHTLVHATNVAPGALLPLESAGKVGCWVRLLALLSHGVSQAARGRGCPAAGYGQVPIWWSQRVLSGGCHGNTCVRTAAQWCTPLSLPWFVKGSVPVTLSVHGVLVVRPGGRRVP